MKSRIAGFAARIVAGAMLVVLAGCAGGAVVGSAGSGGGPLPVPTGHGSSPSPGAPTVPTASASPTATATANSSGSPGAGSTPNPSSTSCPATTARRSGMLAVSADRFAWSQGYERSRHTGRSRQLGGGPASLYSGPAPRPGPDILYAPLATAPQLQNSGIWTAPPILVSGTSSYRSGEYVYQDFLYDDHGARGAPDPNQTSTSPDYVAGPLGSYTYPSNPSYAGNAADIVELRLKPLNDSTAFRMTFNSMIDPTLVGFTIGLGSMPASTTMPFSSNTKQIAQVYLTVHGTTAVATDAATGAELASSACASAFFATVDPRAHQIEVRLPYSVFDTRGNSALRVSVASGLWDLTNNHYLAPAAASSNTMPGGGGIATASSFFNVGFRHAEGYSLTPAPATGNIQSFRDTGQATALLMGDVTSFFDLVNMNELASNTNDDMVGLPQGVITTGPFDRIFVSHYTSGAGQGFAETNCDAFASMICTPEYLGNLQPYAIYVPKKLPPSAGYGMTLQLHALTGTYNQLSDMKWQMQLGERDTGSIVITPEARGPDNWYYGLSAADVFEAWADVAAKYPLDPTFTAIDGYSMGGYASFKFSETYPDLFARTHTLVGTVAVQADYSGGPVIAGNYTLIPTELASLRNLPIMMYFGAQDVLVPVTGSTLLQQDIDALKYRYEWDLFNPGEHNTIFTLDIFDRAAAFLGGNRVDRNPAHVTYVLNPLWAEPSYQMENNHAYWLSNVTLRDGTGANPIGTIDVASAGFAQADPIASAETPVAGVAAAGATTYMGFTRTWAAAAPRPIADALTITATNVSNVEINPQRARADCNAALDVTTDGPLFVTMTGCGSHSFLRGRSQNARVR